MGASVLPEGPVCPEATQTRYRETVYDAMIVVASGRIFLDETVEATPSRCSLQNLGGLTFILSPSFAAAG